MSANNSHKTWDNCEFVFSKKGAYKIDTVSGEEVYYEYENLWKDYAAEVEGLPDDLEVFVSVETYKSWLYTKQRILK